MTEGDARDFLQFVAGTGTQDAARLEGASMTYQTEQIAAALRSGDDAALHTALVAAGQADGVITKANFEFIVDHAEDEDAARQAAAERRMAAIRIATAVSGIAAAGGGAAFPAAAPFISGGNAVVGQILGSFADTPEPQAPHTREATFDLDQVQSSNHRNWYLLRAMDEANMDVPDDLLDYDTLAGEPGNPERAETIVHQQIGADGQQAFDTRRDDIHSGAHNDRDRAESGWTSDDNRGEDAMRNMYNRPDLMWSADPEWIREQTSTYDHEGTYGSDGEQRR
jgi:hypothetical protein